MFSDSSLTFQLRTKQEAEGVYTASEFCEKFLAKPVIYFYKNITVHFPS